MDITELSMLLESLDCHEVTVAEIETAVAVSSKISSLDSDQKLLLYALYKQFMVGDVNIPEPDKKDLVASSKWFETILSGVVYLNTFISIGFKNWNFYYNVQYSIVKYFYNE